MAKRLGQGESSEHPAIDRRARCREPLVVASTSTLAVRCRGECRLTTRAGVHGPAAGAAPVSFYANEILDLERNLNASHQAPRRGVV